ncbi:MAG: MarR family transcriptional regulator [Candidatus Bathyarchaeales archaeon]
MSEALLFLAGIFFAVALGAAFEYYKHISKAKKEYEKAKGAFNEVILSFSRELKRVAETLKAVAYKVDAASSISSEALKKAENLEDKVSKLETKADVSPEDVKELQVKLEEVDKKTRDIVASHEMLTARISALEEQVQKVQVVPEPSVEAVIPIKREKALAPLTETELAVLEMLATEGPKTAPEIKERIKLSREHTARLMKKLYEEGYLERDSSKIPFKYGVKKEMEKLLKKTEANAS